MYRTSENALALTAGGSPILAARTTEVANLQPVEFAGTRGEPVTGHSNPWIYRTTNDGSAGYPFSQFGNLVIQARSNASQHIVFVAGSTPAPVLSVTADGRVRAHVAGSAAYPTYSFFDDTDTGIYRPSADQLGLATGGTIRLQATNGGVSVTTLGLILSRPDESRLVRGDTNGLLVMSGGSSWNNGGVVRLYGADHSSTPSRGALHSGATLVAYWQGSTFTVPTTLVIPVK